MRLLCTLYFLLILPVLAAGQEYIHLAHSGKEIGFSNQVSYLVDSAGRLTISELTEQKFDSKFIPFEKNFFNFQSTRNAVWIKALFVCNEPGPYFVRVTPPMLDSISFFTKENGVWREQKGGYFASRQEINYHAPNWTFQFSGEEGDTVPVFLRMRSDMPLVFSLYAGDVIGTAETLSMWSVWNGIFLGIMLLMSLYNLFLFITSRESVYMYYVLYIITAGLFVSLASGAATVLPEILTKLHQVMHTLIPSLFGVFGMIFTRSFLNTPKYFKSFDKFLYVLFPGALVTIVLSVVDRQLGSVAIQILGGLFTILSITAGIKVWRSGYKPAIYYVFGFGSYMLFLLAYIFLGIIEVDTGDFAPYSLLMIGSAIEAVILSFAIGDKLNVANKHKQQADQERLMALEENERIIREQNIVLERRVEERTAEIHLQKSIIEEKNKDILDSIHYAKRIQSALLASETLLNENLPDHFVLYQPKDIVSGDFYWADKLDNGKFLLLTGDCTGHGVPGAFMSLLNISLLHEFSIGQQVHRPDLLLNKQRDAIIAALNPPGSSEISKDGMDCVLISFDFVNMKMQFACSNNAIWILRDGTLIEYKGDKLPIGVHEGTGKPFTLHEFDLHKGDIIYTFTDGFADQFGGSKGKKYKYSRLKGFLTGIAEKPAKNQLESLRQEFNAWRGDLEQVDDILVIGIRI